MTIVSLKLKSINIEVNSRGSYNVNYYYSIENKILMINILYGESLW